MGKALYEYSIEQNSSFELCSMYDETAAALDNPYFPSEYFKGFGKEKLAFTTAMVNKGRQADTVILSHVNLLVVGWMIKKISPKTQLIMLAHGIEVWYPTANHTRNMLQRCDQVWSVSNFTREKIIAIHGLDEDKCAVLNNCLDPFLPLPSVAHKDQRLLDKYGFDKNDLILMTLTRLSSRERYKGYDKVIEAMAGLKSSVVPVKYLVAGSYDATEKAWLDEMILKEGLEGKVVLTGYIQDEELEAHFALSDIYIMPSRKEGFGIVFIEAMYYGLPVIGGNIDGTTDALLNGELGQLVNPDNVPEIQQAIEKIIKNKEAYMPNRELLLSNFSYTAYKGKLEGLLSANVRITD